MAFQGNPSEYRRALGIQNNKHVLQVSVCPTKMSGQTERTYKEKKMKEILSNICALLNSGGGTLVLPYEKTPPKNHVLGVARMIEQRTQEFTGCVTMVSKIVKCVQPQRIEILVKPSEDFFTLNYNLFLPTETQVIPVPATDPAKEVKEILKGTTVMGSKSPQLPRCRDFVKSQNSGLQEGTSVQLKNLKSSAAKCVHISDRIVNKSNKLTCYASAFANHEGGQIYYGIKDDGIVEGQLITEADKVEVIQKVNRALTKMIWPKHVNKPEKGKNWNLYFESVKDSYGNPIKSTSVIVIEVYRCPGGVFTEEPESFHIIRGKAERMSMELWKQKFMSTHPENDAKQPKKSDSFERRGDETASGSPAEIERNVPEDHTYKEIDHLALAIPVPGDKEIGCARINPYYVEKYKSTSRENYAVPYPIQKFRWSCDRNRKIYIALTFELVKCRNDLNMELFNKISGHATAKYRDSDAPLIVKSEKVAVAYKEGDFEGAERLLCEYVATMNECVKDGLIFEVRELYLRSRIERARGNYSKSYQIALDGLQLMQSLPVEFITVWFYLHAAMLAITLSSLVSDPQQQDDLADEGQTYLELATRGVNILDEYPKEKADLQQKLHIYKAMTLLRCPLTGDVHPKCITRGAVKEAQLELTSVHESTFETKLTHFRKIQYLLLQCDLKHRLAEISSDEQDVVVYLKEAKEFSNQAHLLSKRYKFKEMVDYADRRSVMYAKKEVVVDRSIEEDGHEKTLKYLEEFIEN